MNCVILQPSYIPWRGFFHQVFKADLFIFYDDVQYDKHGWRNRNRVKAQGGSQWLTIPVLSKGAVKETIPINQIRINWAQQWNRKHLTTLTQLYGKAPYFKQYADLLKQIYEVHTDLLADFVIDSTILLARELGNTHTRFMRSSDLTVSGSKSDRLIAILKEVGATHYISGPSAQSYIEENKFSDNGITIEYMDYRYPDYQQLYPPFDPYVTILDLMFMTGSKAAHYFVEEGNGDRTPA